MHWPTRMNKRVVELEATVESLRFENKRLSLRCFSLATSLMDISLHADRAHDAAWGTGGVANA
jgi:hypothetical protein